MAKVSRSRYKSYGQSQRFQNRGDVLRSSIDRIRQQRDTEIGGLKSLAENEQRNSELQIRGIDRVARTESENRNIIKNFEDKVTANKRSAIEVRANREIEAILGRAKEYEKQEKFWQDFAVNHSQKYGKLAQGLVDFAQKKQADRMLEDLDPYYAYNAAEVFTDATKSIEDNANKEIYASDTKTNPLDPTTKKDIVVRASTSNIHYHNKMVQEIREGRAFYTSLLQRIGKYTDKDGVTRSMLTPSTAIDTYISYSYNLLDQLGIPRDSKAGREITNQFAVWGRDVAEVRYNQETAAMDKKAIELKAETLASEIKLALDAADGDAKTKLWENVQITHQGLHHIIQGATYESSDGKFGLRTWNPQTTNAEILELTFDYFKDLPYEELFEIYDSILIFDPKSGNLLKEKGETVGMLSKSKDLQDKLVELVNNEAKRKDELVKAQQNSERENSIAPFEAAWQKGIDTGDWTEFNNVKRDYIQLLETPLFKDTHYQETGYDRLNYSPTQYGNFNTYENALGAITNGSIDEAVIILANNAGGGEIDGGYANTKQFESIGKAVQIINNLDGDTRAIDKAALNIYKLSFGKTAFKDSLITEADQRIITAIKQHLIREIVANPSDDPAYKVFADARATVSEAFLLGIEKQQGIYTATEAAVSNWTPSVKDPNGKVVKKGGYGREGENSSRPASLNNFVFHNFDDKIDNSVTLSAKTIAKEFILPKFANLEGGPITLSKEYLEQNIESNLNGPNSILTIDEKNFITSNVLSGRADNRAINSNLKVLITMAKKYNPSITTKDVMDMVVNGLAANSQGGYGQLEGKNYPMGLEDITKKLTGKCTKSVQNNMALCVAELFKQNGVDINNVASDDFLNLYK